MYCNGYVKLIFVLSIMISGNVYADANHNAQHSKTCAGCHTNPEYKKEDMGKLKQCLACHGSAAHPYKKGASGGLAGAAEAAEKNINSDFKNREITEADLKDMLLIPDGEFIMGSDNRMRDEKPLHVVYLKAFYIDRFEMTNEDYKKFVDAAGYHAPDNWLHDNWKGGNYPPGKGNHPVIFVNWNDADVYCKWRGKRLPREREWEKAARGTDGRTYPWGNEWDMNKSNNPLRGHKGTMAVGSFKAGKSPYGLYDMSGNVWEWVDDYYLPHPGSDYVNPEFGQEYRLLKGGSWWDCSFYSCGISAPVFNRAFFDASTKNDSLGFRCAADAK